MKHEFAFFDGDNVGNTLQILLLENKISQAQILSENINKTITEIDCFLKDKGEILIIGGDDILVKFESNDNLMNTVEQVRQMFMMATGLTMSCGIGEDIKTAIYHLSVAKLYGKNQITFSK